MTKEAWPEIPLVGWDDTYQTLRQGRRRLSSRGQGVKGNEATGLTQS